MNALDHQETPIINARDVHRTYGSVRALSGIELEVNRGEIVAILGPNGAGQTTLVEILEGLRRRDGGEVSVLGQDPERAEAAWRARIGAVLQLGTETDEFTVAEMLDAHAAYYPHPRLVTDIVEALDLAGLEDRRVRRLSGGQRRRLDIALGIVGDPEVLFLDEPTTGLDAEVRRSIWQLIRHLADDGTTIVLTTHYLDEVEHLAARTLVLVDGEIVWSGETGNLRDNTAPTAVAFGLRPPLLATDLPPSLGNCAEQSADGRVTIKTQDSTQVVSDLMRWASSVEGPNPVTNLQVGQPSLEDAYLALLDTTHAKDLRS